ncbi:MAG TPA: GTPase, partial [Myxococcaceae bacterium]|nr:GTPase [Myxococcaceae bacterium]
MTTIVAIATPPVAGGIGVLRISGADALAVCLPLVGKCPEAPVPRHAYFTPFVDRGGSPLDEGLFLYFRAPNSFTGEEVVELQTHGSPRLLTLLQGAVLQDDRVRLAEPGEFSRRAFLNGRIDLTRAEAVADLVAASSEAAVRAAAAQLRGALAERIESLRVPLLALQADLEGVLGFADEAEGADAEASARLDGLVTAAGQLLGEASTGRLIRRGARVVLFGPVNAGKSTLFNRLLSEERALVDEEPGTTRDVLEARLELGGVGVTLVDTAGLREGAGRLEALGIARAREALRGADLGLLVLPCGTAP